MIGLDAGAPVLVGRDREEDVLRRFVGQIQVSGGTLLVTGDAGVGKTVLLQAAAASARSAGTRVVKVIGSEFEVGASFSGLNQALLPFLDHLDGIGAEHADALRVALGFGAGTTPTRGLLAEAVLALIRELSVTAPVLLVIDDLPWIDRASAGVLSAVARRLVGARAGILAAFRTGDPGFFDRTGLSELTLAPLAPEASQSLLGTRFPTLNSGVHAQVLAAAEGNPLALLQLPQALSEPQRHAAEPLPDPLPLGQRLQRVFASRIGVLPEGTRVLLLTAALEGTGDVGVLRQAHGGPVESLLGPAEAARLVQLAGGARQLVFEHPLVRAAVVGLSTSAERRRIHRRLAGVMADDLERRARHLGEATVEPDEAVAALLERAARRVLVRGDAQACVEMLCRAADLSPLADRRHGRLAQAAFVGAESIGATGSAQELLTDIRDARVDHSASLHYATAAALVMLNTDVPLDSAHRLLVAAIEGYPRRTDANDTELIDAIWGLALVSWVGGRTELWTPFHTALAALRPGPPVDLEMAEALFADPAHRGLRLLPRLEAGLVGADAETDPTVVQNLAGCAFWVDRLGQVREPLWRAITEGRAGGPARRHLVALMDVCVDDFQRGRWVEQAELAAEGLRVCDGLGGSVFSFYFRYHQALLAAVQGRFGACRSLTAQMLGWAGPRGAGTAERFARHALVLSALGQGDWESAFRHAEAVSAAGELAPHVPHALWVAMDLVEAGVRTGRRDLARAHVRALREADVAALSPRLAMHVAAAEALVAPDEAAPGLFEAALGLPTVGEWPFDAARIRLNHGERLRRIRATTRARAQLAEALAVFRDLGAAPWAERAERELRAAGQADPGRGVGSLTAQERQIADLAAQGLTNREIAERLVLSPRTVGSHLYRVFPKLGIAKRAALRDALDALDG
ncbi:ATP-binding protein [Streptomyces mirabilis]|uniref:ATP-binding protein n=1 Tax=Streptomyces mirabilis TaxID=68239 RepID=UPI00368F4A21